ncbi:MAG: SufD family Fe-S cluster assembly protein [Clostridiales bacterium]|nr:SufD family Fe-S cluster assembly protein [Clostridiales bacterium]
MEKTIDQLLKIVADIPDHLTGAYNIRLNGKSAGRENTENVTIQSKENGSGIDVFVKANTKGEKIYIPVAINSSGLDDTVYNDFFIGENAHVEIIAGCGIHNDGCADTRHNGIHSFFVGENAKVTYVEKHYGEGIGTGERTLDPETVIHLEKGSRLEMESVQIKGVDSTKRVTKAEIGEEATLVIKEIILTDGVQEAVTDFYVDLNGKNSGVTLSSRSVAKGDSKQVFYSVINGNNACNGHSECDAIIMDNACVKAVPDVTANHVDAALIHEAAIGKIAGEQIVKLMTLGMTEEEAEKEIIAGFLQ